MTRKDYILIAAAVRDSLTDPEFGLTLPDREAEGAHRVALRLANALAADNPRFDRARFIEACGLTA